MDESARLAAALISMALAAELKRTLDQMAAVDAAIVGTVALIAEAADRYVTGEMNVELIHMECFERSRSSINPKLAEIGQRRYARHQAAAISWASR